MATFSVLEVEISLTIILYLRFLTQFAEPTLSGRDSEKAPAGALSNFTLRTLCLISKLENVPSAARCWISPMNKPKFCVLAFGINALNDMVKLLSILLFLADSLLSP